MHIRKVQNEDHLTYVFSRNINHYMKTHIEEIIPELEKKCYMLFKPQLTEEDINEAQLAMVMPFSNMKSLHLMRILIPDVMEDVEKSKTIILSHLKPLGIKRTHTLLAQTKAKFSANNCTFYDFSNEDFESCFGVNCELYYNVMFIKYTIRIINTLEHSCFNPLQTNNYCGNIYTAPKETFLQD